MCLKLDGGNLILLYHLSIDGLNLSVLRYIDMAERLCQKRALETFQLDPEKWGGKQFNICIVLSRISIPLRIKIRGQYKHPMKHVDDLETSC